MCSSIDFSKKNSNAFFNDPTPDKISLFSLPSEMIVKIFSFLTLQALGRAALVCSRFSVLQRDQSIWKNIWNNQTLLYDCRWNYEHFKLDLEGEKSYKDQFRDTKITLPYMNIFPKFQKVLKEGNKIILLGKIQFTHTQTMSEYLELAKQAMAYLPQEAHITLWRCPQKFDEHTMIYSENKNIVTWKFLCDIENYGQRPSPEDEVKIEEIEKNRIPAEISFPKK